MLRDADPEIRLNAAMTINYYAQNGIVIEDAMQPLIALLRDRNKDTRSYAASSLAFYAERGITSRQSVRPLALLLNDPDGTVRNNAERALDSIASRYNVSREELVRSPEKVVRDQLRRKELKKLPEVIKKLVKEKGIVPIREIPRGKFMGAPLLSDTDIVNAFNEWVNDGFRGIVDGKLLVDVDYVEEKISELSKLYSRISIPALATRIGISPTLLRELLEQMAIRGAISVKIDPTKREVIFAERELIPSQKTAILGEARPAPPPPSYPTARALESRIVKLLNVAPDGSVITLEQLSNKLQLPPEQVDQVLIELASDGKLPGNYNPFTGEFTKVGFDVESVDIAVGFDRVGDQIKVGIKITNLSSMVLRRVLVVIQPPEGFKSDSTGVKLGEIEPGSFKSANFRIQPPSNVCAVGNLTGSVIWQDITGKPYSKIIPPRKISVVCPFLKPVSPQHITEIMQAMSRGGYKHSSARLTVEADPQTTYNLAVKE